MLVTMSPAVRVALIGFTPFERNHIESCLAQAGPGQPRYVLASELAGCGLVICNADDEAAAAAVAEQGRGAGCVMLGTQARPGVAAQLSRPIRPVQLQRVLARLAQSTPAMSADMRRVQDELARLATRPAPLEEPAARRTAGGASPLIQGRRPKLDHILVIDDDDGVLRFLAEAVQRYGFQVHLARSAADGLLRARRRHFEFVFLATGLDGMDVFHACKTLKRSAAPGRLRPPSVVLLLDADADTAVDQLRARMAGADAWLHKPLSTAALLPVLGAREVASQAYADTAQTISSTL